MQIVDGPFRAVAPPLLQYPTCIMAMQRNACRNYNITPLCGVGSRVQTETEMLNVSQSATNGRQSARDDLFAFAKRYFNYLEIVNGENNNGYVGKKRRPIRG